ncbi:uncharacterized protein [Euwallacea fornicatus]|uniref:uncharacterized protein n=1 Tax=Euwallacea fornicatus TaxID=995702 RepID=UPI00338F2BD7
MDRKPENQAKKKNNKKPQVKCKQVPPVRLTLTAYKRMLKANPLLEVQESGISIDQLAEKLFVRENSTKPIAPVSYNPALEGFVKPVGKIFKQSVSVKPELSFLRPEELKCEPAKNSATNKCVVNTHPKLHGNNDQDTVKASIKSQATKAIPTSSKSNVKVNVKPSECKEKVKNFQFHRTLKISKSEELLDQDGAWEGGFISPILEEKKTRNNFNFRTPTPYDRSYSFATPQFDKQRKSFVKSTPAAISLPLLQERLDKWLQSRGKPPALFHHLRRLEAKTSVDQILYNTSGENKENVEVAVNRSESYESLNIPNEPKVTNEGECKVLSNNDLEMHAKEAVIELLKLTEEGYPRTQCMAWLDLLKERYNKIVQEPEYWECRAAIEQSVGNIHNAVEYYQEAIVHGAEVNSVNQSLDQLLKKFSLLDINSNDAAPTYNATSHTDKIVAEARNVFISSIINFAVYKRSMKKKTEPSEDKLFVIPVRRSARLSNCPSTSRAVKLCKSLRELDGTLEEINFETNKALC